MMSIAASPGSADIGEYGCLLVAFGLSAAIGLERELRQRSAGLRTHTLVGLGAALIMLTSKFGFADVLWPNNIMLDPSRMAAQIVSGIGFIGGGLIFVRRDAVRGLTTAATIWVVAAVGMAAGAGMLMLAVATTAGHFIVVFAFPPLTKAMHKALRTPLVLRVNYLDGHGVLRDVLAETTGRGFSVDEVATERQPGTSAGRELGRDVRRDRDAATTSTEQRIVSMVMRVSGKASITDLAAALSELDGVVGVNASNPDDASE